MARNVGGVERAMRIVLGLALLAMALLHYVTGGLAILFYIIGAAALLTGLIRFCPAWALFGINTGAAKTPPPHAKPS